VVINIVVAVLLDEFVKAVENERVALKVSSPDEGEKSALDPLLACLVLLNSQVCRV